MPGDVTGRDFVREGFGGVDVLPSTLLFEGEGYWVVWEGDEANASFDVLIVLHGEFEGAVGWFEAVARAFSVHFVCSFFSTAVFAGTVAQVN